MTVELGSLVRVDAKSVWGHEARGFTPWLLANAKVLSEAVDMDLDLHRAEHPVGDFSLDLIGLDRRSGATVIIENQLATSDHGHLGQLLTYAGGTGANNIIWITTGFRPEHTQALTWLNEHTDEATRFFAVVVQAVRIGQSLPAPQFEVVVRPNEWGKQVRAATGGQRRWSEDDFFQELADPADQQVAQAARTLQQHTQTWAPESWMYWGTGGRPSMTAQMPFGLPVRLRPWAFWLSDPHKGPWFTINFEYLARIVDLDTLEAFAHRLRPIPGLSELADAASASEWRTRRSTPARTLFADPDKLTALVHALDELYDSVRQSQQSPPAAVSTP